MIRIAPNLRLLTLVLALLAGGLSGCSDQAQSVRSVTVRAGTAADRRETIAELRTAWRTREKLADTPGQKAEMRFLVRVASAVRKFEHTESYGDICKLWNECMKDHLARFPDSAG